MSEMLKIGIEDCGDGNLVIDNTALDDVPEWKPYWVVEVDEATWHEWQEHLKAHAKWDHYWNSLMIEANVSKRK